MYIQIKYISCTPVLTLGTSCMGIGVIATEDTGCDTLGGCPTVKPLSVVTL